MWPFKKPQHNARELVAGGAVLLDVRSVDEFSAQHIPGALNIPVNELPARMSELRSKALPVVVYCRSGARSAMATQMLRRAGYEVVDIGSISSW